MTKKNDIFHSKNYLILNFLILLGYILLYPIITSKIDPEKFGNYILAYTVATIIVAISNLGIREAYKRNFFEFYKKKKETEILLFSVQIFILFISGIVLLLNFFLEEKIIFYFKELNYIENFWLILLFALMLESISRIYLVYLQNNRYSQKYFFITFLKNVIYFISVFYFLFNNYELASLIYGLLLSNLTLFLLVFYFQIENTYFEFNSKFLKSILILSLPSTPKILFGQINAKIDKILISIFSSIANTGIYSIAQSLSSVIFQIMTSLDKVFITQTNKMLFNNENKKIGNYLTSYIYFCSLPAIGLILFNDIVLLILIDSRYHGSENVIIILSIYYFSLIFGKVSGAQLMYSKKVWLNTNFFILNVLLNFLLNIPLIYYYGIVGAAAATLIASSISLVLSLNYAKKFAPIYYNKKKILIIFIFLFISSIYSILINENILEINNFQNFLFSLIIIILFLAFGFLNKIYEIKDIKEIFKLK